MQLVEQGGGLPSAIRPWLTGRCYDFALALSLRMPDAEFICVGDERFPDHVALRKDGKYYDVRGEMDQREFVTAMRGDDPYRTEDIRVIPRETVERNAGCAGMAPPYHGNRDMDEARRAVTRIFGKPPRAKHAKPSDNGAGDP